MHVQSFQPLCRASRARAFRRGITVSVARGMTVIELMISVMILMILVGLAVSGYQNYQERIRVSQAITEVGAMSVQIKHYMLDNQGPPASLADIGLGSKLDPWGRAYYYLDLTGQNGKGNSRRDKKLNPLNSDFDLYSAGKDGLTQTQLTAHNSRDDIIRARDGKFIGLASDFDP
jgi:general secretion pathway protein G